MNSSAVCVQFADYSVTVASCILVDNKYIFQHMLKASENDRICSNGTSHSG